MIRVILMGDSMNSNLLKMVAVTGVSAFLMMGCGEEEKEAPKPADVVPASQPSTVTDEPNALDKMKEGTAMALEGAKEKASEVSEQMSESTSELVEKASDATADMVGKAKEVTAESLETVKDVTADTVQAAKEMTAEGADKVKDAVQ